MTQANSRATFHWDDPMPHLSPELTSYLPAIALVLVLALAVLVPMNWRS